MTTAHKTPLKTLQRYFSYPDFRSPQETVIQHILSGRHALVIMPTGMGKSLCFQIPALMSESLCIVLSPLIALMKDQVDQLVEKGIPATYINSSLKRHQRQQRMEQVKAGHVKLLYVAPERFRKAEFRELVKDLEVSLLAIDEAHCMSEWGHDFRPDYSRIAEFRELINNPVTVALTATATPEVQRDIRRQLGFAPDEMPLFHVGIARPNLSLSVSEVWDDNDKCRHIVEALRGRPGSAIVYFSLIKTLERFSDRLLAEGLDHVVYHGKLSARERREIQDLFMEGVEPIVLATNAFGMGIDKADIRQVIHAELPSTVEAYYQEIGRAGRDGEDSECTLLYCSDDLMTQMQFLDWSHPGADDYFRLHRLLLEDLEKVQAFGFEWLQKQYHPRGKHNHQLETALGMLERHGVIEGDLETFELTVTAELPEALRDKQGLDEAKKRSQLKLHSLVQYAKLEEGRKAFLMDYFGLN